MHILVMVLFPINDDNRPLMKPYVNYGLLLSNLSVFLYLLLEGDRGLSWGALVLGLIPQHIVDGRRIWTILTSMFMHKDVVHLFGNMLLLWVFGDDIEDALGHGRYLLFYLLGGMAAELIYVASLYVTPLFNGLGGIENPYVGSSGAVSAVLGAYILLYPQARIRTIFFLFIQFIYVEVPAIIYIGLWFLIQLIMSAYTLTGAPSGTAFWAHIGGFAAGFLALKTLDIRHRQRQE